MFEIHPAAEENINSKVGALVGEIKAIPMEQHAPEKFGSDVHIETTITEKDIIGQLREAASDYRGNTVARYFIFEGGRYGLEKESYRNLIEVAEKIQRMPAFQNRLSQEYIEEIIFGWIKDQFCGDLKDKSSFSSTLKKLSAESVKPVTVYVPIANMIVQRPFSFCNVIICNITKTLIDEMAKVPETFEDENNRKNAMAFLDRFRKEFQGYAAVRMELNCEAGFASDLAIMTAQKVTSFLSIYSGSVLTPDVKCISKIKGAENLARFTTISKSEDDGFSVTEGILDKSSMRHWRISESDLDHYAKCGLGILSELSNKERPSEFELLILNASTLYSKAAFTAEPLEKLVYVLSFLESTLLKSENEPIQQNLAERLAVFISQKLSERKAIVKSVKLVYGLRSKYLHHGHTSSELEGIGEFLVYVWYFYTKLLRVSRAFKNKAQFLEAIDDHKLG